MTDYLVSFRRPDLGSTVDDYGALWVEHTVTVNASALPQILDWITRSGYMLLEVDV